MPWSAFRRVSPLGLGLALVLLLVAGCSEAMPKTYPVKGKLVLKNGKPYTAGGQITFISVADPEHRGYGTIAKDGTFTLDTIGHTSKGRSALLKGAVEGDFHVNIRPGGAIASDGN